MAYVRTLTPFSITPTDRHIRMYGILGAHGVFGIYLSV